MSNLHIIPHVTFWQVIYSIEFLDLRFYIFRFSDFQIFRFQLSNLVALKSFLEFLKL